MKKKIVISLVGLSLMVNASDFYYQNGKKVEVVQIEKSEAKQKKEGNTSEISYYRTSKGHKVGVKNDILVECIEGVDCKSVLADYETVTISALSDTIFMVTIAKDKNVFEFSQKLYNNEKVKIAHPNFRKTKRRR